MKIDVDKILTLTSILPARVDFDPRFNVNNAGLDARLTTPRVIRPPGIDCSNLRVLLEQAKSSLS